MFVRSCSFNLNPKLRLKKKQHSSAVCQHSVCPIREAVLGFGTVMWEFVALVKQLLLTFILLFCSHLTEITVLWQDLSLNA